MDLLEKFISREEIYDGKVLHLVKDKVSLPNGKTSYREVNLHNGASCVIPVTNDNKIILVQQFRYAINKVTLEVPAGKIDIGEDGFTAAKRELKEEVGIIAKDFIDLGIYYGSPAILSEKIYMYLARNFEKTNSNLDDDEFLNVIEIPLENAVNMVINNEIEDGKTQVCILKANEILKKGSN